MAAAMSPQVADDRDEYIKQLEARLARLETQLTWAQHSKADVRTGGVLTHRESDVHYGDANHLLSSCESTWQKSLEVIRQYEPSLINLTWGDDFVAGRGIYKNQDLDATVSDAESQCVLGAYKFRERIHQLREVSQSDVRVYWLRGNHDYSNGHPLASFLFGLIQQVTRDVDGIKFKLCWDALTLNLAMEGTYNALFMHGYGHSGISPNSPRFISDIKDRLLIMGRNGVQINRVASGHTHWLSVGVERTLGLQFDTTGGWQRNARVQLGHNQRPSGSIVYVSLPGMVGEIANPILISPDSDVYQREIEDAHLPARNLAEAGRCLTAYQTLGESEGWLAPKGADGMLNAGRW